ncbi:TIGR02584 family CRISPR-associated protein [Candidatus Poribacteria bacterium]|nr:TIGR02584 family CRISPR-associated protein [Candidatus Poribacteria bacterium]
MPDSRNILISVVGLNPQVITETLYCFWYRISPRTPINEIFALTTLRGKKALERAFLEKNNSQIDNLCRDHNIPPIQFSQKNVHVLLNADKQPLEDIWSVKDNEMVADQIFTFVRKMTSDPDVCLHASIAGGRKTMGLYLGLAMQFYGRSRDTLTHVLVNPELESNPDFFYPPPANISNIILPDGNLFPASQIHIELASIPLLFLREKIPFIVDRYELKYSELIKAAQVEIDGLQSTLPITLNRLDRSIKIRDIKIQLTPLEFALYLTFAQRRKKCKDKCPGCNNCGFLINQIEDGELHKLLKSKLMEMGSQDPRYRDLKAWANTNKPGETPKTRFFETLSRIRQRIRKDLGFASWSHQYFIERKTPRSKEGLYCIPVSPGRIEIV